MKTNPEKLKTIKEELNRFFSLYKDKINWEESLITEEELKTKINESQTKKELNSFSSEMINKIKLKEKKLNLEEVKNKINQLKLLPLLNLMSVLQLDYVCFLKRFDTDEYGSLIKPRSINYSIAIKTFYDEAENSIKEEVKEELKKVIAEKSEKIIKDLQPGYSMKTGYPNLFFIKKKQAWVEVIYSSETNWEKYVREVLINKDEEGQTVEFTDTIHPLKEESSYDCDNINWEVKTPIKVKE